MKIENLKIKEIHQRLLKKDFSAIELTNFFLEKIKKEDEKIGAFLEIFEKEATKKAKEVDEKIRKGEEISILAGIPCAIKDNILVKGKKCTAGSKILENYIASYDATVIEKLKKEDVIILGKTNLDEFAMGSSTENSAFKITKNPHDLERVPGGSSGGSAAAVAKNFCQFALGSDTGGSIRQPASFCGIVGLKPTYGSVSRFGLIAFASSLDQIGPMTKNVEDCEIVFEKIRGKDEMDSTSISKEDFFEFDIRKTKIGLPKEYFIEGLDKEIEKATKEVAEKCQKEGAGILEISLSHTEYALPCYYIIASAEASSNLARYDGIKYGFQKKGKDILDLYFESRGEGFGKEVKRRILLGTFVLSTGYFEAYYLKAQITRELIKKDFKEAFEKVDFIFTPVSPVLPFKLGERIEDPVKMYLSDIFTVSVNLAGLPAISLPIKKISGLPVGLQIIGKPFSERKIFQIAKFVEKICS